MFFEVEAYPFPDRVAQELWRVLTTLYPSREHAIELARIVGIDLGSIPRHSTAFQTWSYVLFDAAAQKKLRALVDTAAARNAGNERALFLDALRSGRPLAIERAARVEAEDEQSRHRPDLTRPGVDEALLFRDSLMITTGQLPALIRTLDIISQRVPSVCRLSVNPGGSLPMYGTGFRIGPRRILTNHHVLCPGGVNATVVFAEFDAEVDETGRARASTQVPCDTTTIRGKPLHDWAVIEADGLKDSWPPLDTNLLGTPQRGDQAFVIQHPMGLTKHVGFVRNTISFVGDDFVEYLTDTQVGSSGSPVLDRDGRLIALHHRGGAPISTMGRMPIREKTKVYTSLG